MNIEMLLMNTFAKLSILAPRYVEANMRVSETILSVNKTTKIHKYLTCELARQL